MGSNPTVSAKGSGSTCCQSLFLSIKTAAWGQTPCRCFLLLPCCPGRHCDILPLHRRQPAGQRFLGKQQRPTIVHPCHLLLVPPAARGGQAVPTQLGRLACCQHIRPACHWPADRRSICCLIQLPSGWADGVGTAAEKAPWGRGASSNPASRCSRMRIPSSSWMEKRRVCLPKSLQGTTLFSSSHRAFRLLMRQIGRTAPSKYRPGSPDEIVHDRLGRVQYCLATRATPQAVNLFAIRLLAYTGVLISPTPVLKVCKNRQKVYRNPQAKGALC